MLVSTSIGENYALAAKKAGDPVRLAFMPEDPRSAEEKLELLGERLRAAADKSRPVPRQAIENALKPSQEQTPGARC